MDRWKCHITLGAPNLSLREERRHCSDIHEAVDKPTLMKSGLNVEQHLGPGPAGFAIALSLIKSQLNMSHPRLTSGLEAK